VGGGSEIEKEKTKNSTSQKKKKKKKMQCLMRDDRDLIGSEWCLATEFFVRRTRKRFCSSNFLRIHDSKGSPLHPTHTQKQTPLPLDVKEIT
jgi:hypothetical protein